MTRLISGLAGTLTLLALATGVSAYTGEVPVNLVLTSSGTIAAGSPIPICATVLGASGTGVPGVTVTFAITEAPSGARDILSSTTAVTNASGVACVSLTLDAVVGTRKITATAAGGVLGTITIVLQPSGLPNTATAAARDSADPLPVSVVLITMVAGIFGIRRLGKSRSARGSHT